MPARWPCSLLAVAALLAVSAAAEPGRVLRVGTSGDYAPFSLADGVGGFRGFDAEVARAYAKDRGLRVEWVRFAWPRLLAALAEDRLDVAMSGVTVRPERSAAGRFSVPVAETGAVVLVREPDRFPDIDTLDAPAVRIGVNAGGHLEQVARRRFPRATRVAIPDNTAVVSALHSEAVDAVVSEEFEAVLWLAELGGGAVYGPFTRDRKAYLVHPKRAALAADLDAWLLAREADGTLAALRALHLPAEQPGRPAAPLAALLAAVDERLALMPLVGAAKRDQGHPLEVPEREGLVLDAAVAAVAAAATKAGVEAPDAQRVRAFFRAQIEAAKQVQWTAVNSRDFEPPEPLPDVDAVLRPALLRIGEKIARLLVALPPGLDEAAVRRAAKRALRSPYLDPARTRDIASALVALASPSDPRDQPGRQTGQHGQQQTDAEAQRREAEAEDRQLPGHEAVQRQ